MWVDTSANTISSSWLVANGFNDTILNSGRCIPASNQYDGTCVLTEMEVPLAETSQVLDFLWADFTGGAPKDSVDPAEITGFAWYFAWGGDTDTSYDVDLVLDELGFIE